MLLVLWLLLQSWHDWVSNEFDDSNKYHKLCKVLSGIGFVAAVFGAVIFGAPVVAGLIIGLLDFVFGGAYVVDVISVIFAGLMPALKLNVIALPFTLFGFVGFLNYQKTKQSQPIPSL